MIKDHIQFGAENASGPAIRQKRLMAIRRLGRKPMLRIDGETGEIFGSLAAQLSSKRGSNFRIQDLWLAAQTIQHSHKFLTSNRKDFEDISGLDMVLMPSIKP